MPTETARGPLLVRLGSAVRRRLRRALQSGRQPAVEAALDWLLRAGDGEGVRESPRAAAPCPALTGAAIETAAAYGCRREATHWARWLVSVQGLDGSLGAAECCGPALVSTSWALRGLLAILDDEPEFEGAAMLAARRLRQWVGEDGRLLAPWADSAHLGGGVPPDLRPLAAAGARRPETDWAECAGQVMDHWARAQAADHEADDEDAPLYLVEAGPLARCADIYLQTGRDHAAAELLRRAEAVQRRSGAVHEHLRHGPVVCRSMARLAVAWYRAGQRGHGDRAVAFLESVQARDGGFPRRAGWPGRALSSRRDAWAAKHYLDAAWLRVCAAFEGDPPEVPGQIVPHDGRMEAVRQWFAALPAGAAVADVGCGRGRYLHHLAAEFPTARLVGIDASRTLLACLPPGVKALEGSLLRIPLPDGSLDGVLAVESLEHSLLPERAVAELCRVVKPGGRVLLIDKDRRKQALSEHEPWERWFAPEELTAWLSRWCNDVSVSHVAHSEGRPGNDLFLAASGVRFLG